MSSGDALALDLAGYLSATMGKGAVRVSELARIPGGASRQTYRFIASYEEAGEEISRPLILRRDPAASLIETERTTEFAAYRAFHSLGLPVPEAIALELDGAALERPFFIMEAIEQADAASILAPNAYDPHREKTGRQFWDCLGRIAAADPDALGLTHFSGARDVKDCWTHELQRWERVILEDAREPQPIALGAIRWLRRHPPPPAQKLCVVHGDYRSGNFLFNSDGEIRAILDWEMAHLGDPYEDIGWALDPLWSHGDPSRPAGLIPRAEALAIWQSASGLSIDAKALYWWELFAHVKGLAIWISAAKEYAEGRNTEAVNAFSAWYPFGFHNRLLAERMAAECAA